jgi:hypothetical protein
MTAAAAKRRETMRHERIAAEPAGTGLGQPVTGADLVAAQLAAAGATHAFGIPGGEVLALVDALGRAGIRFELARHENAAGFMAEGLWHATGALPCWSRRSAPASPMRSTSSPMRSRIGCR